MVSGDKLPVGYNCFMLSVALLLCISQTPVPNAQAPKPDRTGEAALRQLLTDMGRISRSEITIEKSARSNRSGVMEPDRVITLDYDSPTKFRIVETGVFGDCSMYVSDGKTLLEDPLDDSQKSVLSKAGRSIYASNKALALKGDAVSLVFYFLAGPTAFDSLVASDSPVTVSANTISFKSKDAGSVKVGYSGTPGKERVTSIEYDNLPYYQERAQRFGGFGRVPENPLTVENVTYREHAALDASLFRTTPHDPKNVEDKRKGSLLKS